MYEYSYLETFYVVISRFRGRGTRGMADVARAVFCNQCGTLVDEPTQANEAVACHMCGTSIAYSGVPAHPQPLRRPRNDARTAAQLLRSWSCARRAAGTPRPREMQRR